MDNRDIEISYGLAARATDRISGEGLEATNINSYIATLTDLANAPVASKVNTDHKSSMDKAVGMYSYLRDKTGAQTVGEAWGNLRGRKVEPGVVRLWVEEEMVANPGLFDSVAQGYPELREDLEKARNAVLDRIIKK